MPRFEIVGIGRETGKSRKRVYTAENREAAIMAAAANGTIVEVDKIRQVPDIVIPATDAQKEYATILGIKFSDKTTVNEMSGMLDCQIHREGFYFERIRRFFTEAKANGEIVNIAYRGGNQPGTQRQIFPLKIKGGEVRARCIASGEIKTYYISRMQLITDDIYFEPYKKDIQIQAQPQDHRSYSPGVAALLSFIIPGAGQMYKGQISGGLIWFVIVVCGYVFFLPGIILHICCIFSAASPPKKHSDTVKILPPDSPQMPKPFPGYP
jgi:TM2 domain-containing membrane protein YozV